MYMNVNNYPEKYRIKIKYPDGFEIEIEGNRDFIKEYEEKILNRTHSESANITELKSQKREYLYSRIIDFKNNIPYIKLKIPELDIQMAILIILTSNRIFHKSDITSALNLSKSLKLSGYNPKRIDRYINNLIKNKDVEAYGTKRNRAYSITDKGDSKATIKVLNITNNLKEKQ